MIETTQRINQLLDWYEQLLTPKQRLIMHYYYHEDYSLREIGELLDISFNAVHDTIVRSSKKLEMFEQKVKACAYAQSVQQLIQAVIANNQQDIQASLKQLQQEENDD